MVPTTRLVIAVARDARERVPENWADAVLSLAGVHGLVGEAQPQRIVVEVDAAEEQRLRASLGPNYHVERPIAHRPLRGGAGSD